MAIEQAIFRRAELLLGDQAMSRIAEKRVIIFGNGTNVPKNPLSRVRLCITILENLFAKHI